MRYKIPVYRAEAEAGLAEAVVANASVAYLAPVEADPGGSEAGRRWASANSSDPVSDDSLFYVKDILVSVGWNKNDDIFTPEEVWGARHTSEDKPLNFEHDRTDVIGHIVSATAVAEDLTPIPEDSAVEDLPEKFHVVNGTVIYRIPLPREEEKARAELIESVIAEIGEGKWFVSMECLFSGFDYGIEDPDGNHFVVARGAETAWLTKYLRAYPPKKGEAVTDRYRASGRFVDRATGSEYRVGRVFRNVTFVGKGIVRKPGNADSIIFSSASLFTPSGEAPVYQEAGPVAPQISTATETPMPETNAELAALQARFDELAKANTTLAAELATLKAAGTEAALAALKAEVADRDGAVASLTTQLDAVKSAVTAQTEKASAAEAALATASAELAALRAEKSAAARVALVAGRGLEAAKAAALVDSLKALDEAAFAATVEVLAPTWAKAAGEPAPKPSDTDAIDAATPEPDAALSVASEAEPAVDDEIANFFADNFRSNRTSR